ncbi:hypothetical protein HHI36_007208 [Cryptolaemus montrouzieri]|uniref:Uncharacterized protein n=1 Tax=Cryptolaemus montrouzieri TaxID=559131 RepID=A0ABD2MP02_9CUCU
MPNDLYVGQGCSLHETLAITEYDAIDADSITLLNPLNACDDITDEDSGDEENFNLKDLPPSQIQGPVEIVSKHDINYEWDSDHEIPLSEIQKTLPKKKTVAIKKSFINTSRKEKPIPKSLKGRDKMLYRCTS